VGAADVGAGVVGGAGGTEGGDEGVAVAGGGETIGANSCS